ncbi:hypothetical protein Tco_0114561, partial [Tanacetum coccineum]
PHLEQDMDPEIQAEIDECFAYADALRDRGTDARVVVEAVDREESETGARGPVEVRVERVTHPVMLEDIPKPAQEGAVEVTYETLGDLVQRRRSEPTQPGWVQPRRQWHPSLYTRGRKPLSPLTRLEHETLPRRVKPPYHWTKCPLVIPVHRIQVIEEVHREQGHRIVGVKSVVIALTERIANL